jgi:hypothetical protein
MATGFHLSALRRAGPTRATAELPIAPSRLPVQANAQRTITETSADASRMVLAWRVSSDLPLAAAQFEQLFADLIRTSLDADHAFILGYL